MLAGVRELVRRLNMAGAVAPSASFTIRGMGPPRRTPTQTSYFPAQKGHFQPRAEDQKLPPAGAGGEW
jgi:hypothetical protein